MHGGLRVCMVGCNACTAGVKISVSVQVSAHCTRLLPAELC